MPVEVRSGHVGRIDASIKADSFAWLTVDGKNATLAATAACDVEVTTAAVLAEAGATVEYLQGDWPVPSIYAKDSETPGLPAAPFITTAALA